MASGTHRMQHRQCMRDAHAARMSCHWCIWTTPCLLHTAHGQSNASQNQILRECR